MCDNIHTAYTMEYAHSFVVPYLVWLYHKFFVHSSDLFTVWYDHVITPVAVKQL